MYDAWADVYDAVYAYVGDDLPYYVREALRTGGPVLELGCGTGRVAIALARAGVDVVGVDFSPRMLEAARRNLEGAGALPGTVTLVEADMRGFEPEQVGGPFRLALIPFRGFLSLLTVPDQISTLQNVRRHLTPDGELIIDLFVPDPEMLVQEGDTPRHFRDVADPRTGGRYVLWQQSAYDNHNQIIDARIIVERLGVGGVVEQRQYLDFQIRYVHFWEMRHLLAACGYEVLDVLGDFDGSPFDDTSSEMIWRVRTAVAPFPAV